MKKGDPMKLFRLMTRREADEILSQGFRDWEGNTGWKGVPLYDRAPDAQDGAFGDVTLAVDIPEDDVAQFEWPYQGTLREFHIPEEIVNRYPIEEVHLGG
jgi:hypothetical protein